MINNYLFEGKKISYDKLFSLGGIALWTRNIVTNEVEYRAEWEKTTGYSIEELKNMEGSWKKLVLPEYLDDLKRCIEDCLSGKKSEYEIQFQIMCKDGSYAWINAKGQVISRNHNSEPIFVMGMLQNIDQWKNSEKRLAETMESLEYNYVCMESAAKQHNQEILEQEKLLSTINQISKKLLSIQTTESFEKMVENCLGLLGENIGKGRVYIRKNFTNDLGEEFCLQLHEWVHSGLNLPQNEKFKKISYSELPTFKSTIENNSCLNCLIKDISDSEKTILEPRKVKAILVAPIVINGKTWGFMGVDNYENEQLFTTTEENLLLMSGSMIANAIERMETEATLREMEERTQIMLNATPLCCNLWSSEFVNIRCNDEAVRLFELSSQQEYLDRFGELSPERQPNGELSGELAIKYINKAFLEGYTRFEWLHQKFDGTPIPAEITLVRIKYKEDFIVAGYTRDLREEKAMMAELKTKEAFRIARDEALLISKAKSNFLANMSHEIRTPMNAISGFAEIILRDSPSKKTSEYANGIKGACKSLINIINDILDISKIESRKLEIYNAPYELASLINDVIAITRMRLGKKPLMFITNIDSRLPARLIGDEIRVKQILLNILSNAINYTKEGFVELSISGEMDGDKTKLYFSIRDSGMGIKEKDIERVFDEFERVNTTKNRSVQGTGLGLAISKQLCELMGGQIAVESVYGRGTEFTVILLQECTDYEPLAYVEKTKRILLYEPRERYRNSIENSLLNLKCECVSCANQSELYDNIKIGKYDYVLTAALHLKKVQDITERNESDIKLAAFVEYEEMVSDSEVYTILFPVNCLQLAVLLNGNDKEDQLVQRYIGGVNFTAPLACVLIVDDNSVNLQVAKGLMKPYAFKIDTASNGMEAIEMVKHIKYDLVFMDHMMPIMDGIDATVEIRKLQGEFYKMLPIIALTANAIVGTKEMFLREGMNDFLAKPIEINKLTQVLLKWLPQDKIFIDMDEKQEDAVECVKVWDIEGVNVIQGIKSVGGNRDTYLKILDAYYADCKRKCVVLRQHLEKNDLVAFSIDVHALKSVSATVGALEVSAMAQKLELAARNGDGAFLYANLADFLDNLQSLLKTIEPILADGAQILSKKSCHEGAREQGNEYILKDKLAVLTEALECANIAKIEDALCQMQGYVWPENVVRVIGIVQECVDVFDYDGALEEIGKLMC